MKNIIKSLVIVVVFAVVAGGAAWACHSSTASITNKALTAGTTVIQLKNSSHSGGSSTLPAEHLEISAAEGEAPELCDELALKFEINCGWIAIMFADGAGATTGLPNANLLKQNWSELAAGNAENVDYEADLPESGDQPARQEKTYMFKLGVENQTNQV